MSNLQFKYPQFIHHGAVDGVTGSCHRFVASEACHYLIDCGLFQGDELGGEGGEDGERGESSLQKHQIEFDLTYVKALIVTHVHIDHIGRLPYLMAAGFKWPIYCSYPSAKLLPLVIEDALKIGFTRDKALIKNFLKQVGKQLVPLDYNQWVTLPNVTGGNCTDASAAEPVTRLRLQRAGHILGSAYVELDASYAEVGVLPKHSHRAVFSGDLGAPHAPLLPAPKSPHKADTLVIESTYGDKLHEDRKGRKQRLKAAIEHALANGGTVMVPAFSIGRTQELLYELEELITKGGASWQSLEVIVDSPLAAKFTEVYKQLKPYWDVEAHKRLASGRHPLSFDNLYTVDTHKEHVSTVDYLAKSSRPAIVLAASGMANGGRILNYLKAMLANPRHAVLFVGYQARGTYGSIIQRYGSPKVGGRGGWVAIDGERVDIKAQVFTINGYSAHADQKDLLNFVKRMQHWPSQVRVIHGDDKAKRVLKQKLVALASSENKPLSVVIP